MWSVVTEAGQEQVDKEEDQSLQEGRDCGKLDEDECRAPVAVVNDDGYNEGHDTLHLKHSS